MDKNIKVGVVDDNKLLVELISDFLSEQQFIKVVITAHSGNSFLQQLQDAIEQPDIIILDLKMADGDGIEVIEKLNKNHPALKSIVLSSYYSPNYLDYMLKIGVHAFIPKETDKELLLKIIYEVADKGHYFTSDQIRSLKSQAPVKRPLGIFGDTLEELTTREIEVLKLICQQKTAKEIGESLFISTKTVETHKSKLLEKSGVKNTAGLIIYAIKNSIVDPAALVYNLRF